MSIEKYGSPGSRLLHVRKKILRITQDELAEKIGVTRSLIPMMEKDKQGVSRATAEKLYAQFGVSIRWLLTGDGEPMEDTGAGPPKDEIVIAEDKKSYSMSTDGLRLFNDPKLYRDGKGKGRFGYVGLSGTKLRMHAARDKAIAGSRLYHLAEDDQLWFVAGEPIGWEFEVLREYFDFGKDRELSEWMECLRFARWQRRMLMQALDTVETGQPEVQSA